MSESRNKVLKDAKRLYIELRRGFLWRENVNLCMSLLSSDPACTVLTISSNGLRAWAGPGWVASCYWRRRSSSVRSRRRGRRRWTTRRDCLSSPGAGWRTTMEKPRSFLLNFILIFSFTARNRTNTQQNTSPISLEEIEILKTCCQHVVSINRRSSREDQLSWVASDVQRSSRTEGESSPARTNTLFRYKHTTNHKFPHIKLLHVLFKKNESGLSQLATMSL